MINRNRLCFKLGRCTKTLIKICLLTLVFIAFMACTAFAADEIAHDVADTSTTNTAIHTMYNFFKGIAAPMALLGIGLTAFSFFIPNEKAHEIAKKRLFYIGVAVVIFFMIPLLVSVANDYGDGIGWNANRGATNAQIIAPASSSVNLNEGPQPVQSDEDSDTDTGGTSEFTYTDDSGTTYEHGDGGPVRVPDEVANQSKDNSQDPAPAPAPAPAPSH